MPRKKVDLDYWCISVKPIAFDFSAGFGETWNIPLNLTEQEIEEETFYPIYNFAYPLDDKFKVPDDFRKKLNSMTIVEIGGKYYLASTCAGQDFSWEMVETYINLGYYPPSDFCDLPRMAGRGENKHDRSIINICKDSLRISMSWSKDTLRRLNVNFKRLKL